MFSETQRIVHVKKNPYDTIDAGAIILQCSTKFENKLMKDFQAKDTSELKAKLEGKTIQVVLQV